jgi:hypothetical protein
VILVRKPWTWKVLSIKGPQPGASNGPIIAKEDAPQAVPSSEEAGRMVLASLLAFNEALQAKSFETFHAGISNLWQEQITPAKLLEVFKPFIDAEINLAPIKPLTPVVQIPARHQRGRRPHPRRRLPDGAQQSLFHSEVCLREQGLEAHRCERQCEVIITSGLPIPAPPSLITKSGTSRIRRRRAQDVADTTDSLRAVACIRFVRPCRVPLEAIRCHEAEGDNAEICCRKLFRENGVA